MKRFLLFAFVACWGLTACTGVSTEELLPTATSLLLITVQPTIVVTPNATSTAILVTAKLPTNTPSATVIPTTAKLPTETKIAAITPTATSTATSTPVPLIQVGSINLPDPRYFNREMFDLDTPDAPIPQFVNAMAMAGIVVDARQVAETLTYRLIERDDGERSVVAVYDLDPDVSQHDETLEGQIPLFVGEKTDNNWKFESIIFRLRAIYDGDKTIGSQVVYYKLNDPLYVRIAAGNFNQLMINGELNENSLWETPRPSTDPYEKYATYDLTRANQLIAFAKNERMSILETHVLEAREEGNLPKWLTAGSFTRNEYIDIMKAHVRQVVDLSEPNATLVVLNEAFDWNRLDGFWMEKIGPEYIEIAFREAREKNPEAVLLYNDVNVFHEGKVDDHDRAVFVLVEDLAGKGLIDGVGFQMHLDAQHRPVSSDVVNALIDQYERIGVKVHVTEFDVDLTYLESPEENRQQMKTRIFGEMFATFLTSPNVESINFFGFSSAISWKPDADAHMFDEYFRPEPAFYEIARVLLAHFASS